MKYIVGAYATSPFLSKNKNLELTFYDKLIESIPEIMGLEIPFFGHNIHRFGSDFLINILRPEWNNVLTCIPGTMENLSINPKYGIASDDDFFRMEAVSMYQRANQTVQEINGFFGKKSFIAVQIVSAPSFPIKGVKSSKYSLLKSMKEILSWDWQGAKIVIEHQDSSLTSQTFEKGFLNLEDEVEVLLKLASHHNTGITINWGRSAIEGRSIQKPIDHINFALENELLSGLIFSGASNSDKLYGDWKDNHIPFAQSYNVNHFEENSLLTHKNISKTLGLFDINSLDYLGIKLLSMPIDKSTIERRIGLNRDAIFILDNVISELNNNN
jgi:hypothetical protein